MSPYVRYPAVAGDRVVFVCDDDLWSVALAGGPTRRLTANQGTVSHPVFASDGSKLAYLSTRDGTSEVYVSDADGGTPTRLTWGSGATAVCHVSEAGVVYASSAGRPSAKEAMLWRVPLEGGEPARLEFGLAVSLAVHGDNVALARHEDDLAKWKRYRGGRVGCIWFRTDGDFVRLDVGVARVANPMWLGGRLWFVSDHTFTANLWSVDTNGGDLRQETHHDDFAVRHAQTDGTHVVYACGADLWRLVPGSESVRVELDHSSPAERLVDRQVGLRHLQSARLHPDGRSLAMVVRGKPVTIGTFEGPMRVLGDRNGPRYRLLTWFHDGERLAAVSDATGEDRLVVFDNDGERTVDVPGLGRPLAVEVSPDGGRVALTDDRGSVAVVHLGGGSEIIDFSEAGRCSGLSWSSDGQWLVYACPTARGVASTIKLWGVDGTTADLTDGRFRDTSPSFDPCGRFVAFLSNRELDPVYDQAYFDVNFPLSVRPYLVTLRGDVTSPLHPEPRAVGGSAAKPNAAETVAIETEGIRDRLIRMPMPSRRYLALHATLTGLVASSEPVAGAGASAWKGSGAPPANKFLHIYHWSTRSETQGLPRHSGFSVSSNGKALLLRVGFKLRVVPLPGPEKKLPNGSSAGRKNGWFAASRVSVRLDLRTEWRQMLRETWRWMRDHFWTDNHSGVDWDAVWTQYSPLLDRVCSRREYGDLVWEMVGELGTSHAYEMLGDYRRLPGWRVGTLAAEYSWADGWRVDRLARGEAGMPGGTSPLTQAGVDVRVGDVIVAVDGLTLAEHQPVGSALVDRGGKRVDVRVRRGDDVRTVTITALHDASNAWYRDWVRGNRERIHAETDGRVGYVHIPDMGPSGYSDFHRDYLRECLRDALIVDVRYNRGGHVSQLILEKLRRTPIGYNQSRWDGASTYPSHAVRGPMVALTNEMAGSDGDIFSHSFKIYGLGPLIGARTWGGVIGIWPRARHADGSITTQPEFSYWFQDVGYQVENYGTDPDIVVPVHPEHYGTGQDVQLERGLAEVLSALETAPPAPDLGDRPYLGRSPKKS